MAAKNKLFTTAYTKSIDEEERSIVAWGSKAIIDRDKEIIRGDAWDLKAYRKHPIILLSHNYKELWVGKALWIKPSEEGLLFKAQFATTEAAKEAFQLVKDLGIAAFSVGFIPKKWEDRVVKDMTEEEQAMMKDAGLDSNDKVKIYTKCELLEISLVSVPACSTAVLEAYNEGKIKTKELKDKLDECIEIIDEIEPEDKSVNEIIDEIKDEVEASEEEKQSDELPDLEEKVIVTKPEETPDYIRLPVKGEEGKHDGHKIRTMDVDEKQGIKSLYCVDCKKTITFLFDKGKGWDMLKAKKWMTEHGKNVIGFYEGIEKEDLIKMKNEESFLSVEDIETEIKNIAEAGKKKEEPSKGFSLDEIYEVVKENKELVKTLEELTVELKAGAVLNRKNKQNLKNAQGLIQEVLDSAEPNEPVEESKSEEIEIEDDDLEIEEKEAKEEPENENKGIDIDEKELVELIHSTLEEYISKSVENVSKNLKQGIDDNFKRLTGKVM